MCLSATEAVLIRRFDEGRKQRMRLQRLGFELGMELATEEERMVGQLHNLDVGPIWCRAADAQAAGDQRALVLAIELVAMAMALADFALTVGLMRQRTWLQLARPGAETHRAAQLLHAAQLAQLVDHPMRRRRIKLAGIGVRQAANIAREFNACGLHPEADAEVRDLVLARVLNAQQHAFDAALAEAAGNENPIN